MRKKKIRYYLRYVSDCTPRLKEFKNKEDLYKFAAELGASSYDNPDNWIDYAFEGKVFLKGDMDIEEV